MRLYREPCSAILYTVTVYIATSMYAYIISIVYTVYIVIDGYFLLKRSYIVIVNTLYFEGLGLRLGNINHKWA